MLFNSIAFAFFLPIVFALYWSTKRWGLRFQNGLVLVASYVFYGWWDVRFLGLIVISSFVDYFVGMRLDGEEHPRKRKWLLALSLAVNLGMLGFFKYFNFFIGSAADLLHGLGLHADPATLNVVLPVGISFYTFQTLSYTLDIYKREIHATRDPVAFFAFVAFFPQLVAGPIERASRLLPQFHRERTFNEAQATDGLRQMLWGFLKKVAIADNLAPHVHEIFSTSATQDGATLWVGVFFFAIQIYCDFSGYSDIAIGTAGLFGFDLMRNFAFPYFSRDIGEFWRRWHISLSSWFRDYVYIPLGGSRVPKPRRILNILVTFTVSGLWHGANWTFVIWGALNGLYYVPLMLVNKQKSHTNLPAEGRLLPRWSEAISILVTFLFTLVAWVFFRAQSLGQALNYIGRMFSVAPGLDGLAGLGHYLWAGLGAIAMLVVEWLQRDKQHALQFNGGSRAARWTAYAVVAMYLLTVGRFTATEFIYFQF